nr:hypothetical protein [Novosphingobium panipatense]
MAVLNDARLYTLKDSPFFRLRTRKKLADLLQISLSDLKEITSSEESYKRKWKHKVDKDSWLEVQPPPEKAPFYRPIDIPEPSLKKVQSRIAKLLSRITPPDWLFSPCKGRSYVDNAARHKGARAFWLLDIKDYFPSCTNRKLAHFFRSDLQCSKDVTAILVRLTTHQSSGFRLT